MTPHACRVFVSTCLSFLALVVLTLPAQAHAFGERYDLPLPLWLFLAGAGLAVALSFAIMALFVTPRITQGQKSQTGLDIPGYAFLCRMLRRPLQAASVLLFLLILATAFFGVESPIRNLSSSMVWVIWWVGFAFFTALVGNIWPLINPWALLFRAAMHVLAPGRAPEQGWVGYPVWLAHWPAVGLFLLFIWFELVSGTGEQPRTIGCLIAAFSLLSWTGMAMFGETAWRANCDPFECFFGFLGRFAPIQAVDGLRLRPHGAGLVQPRAAHPSLTAFVMVMLSVVTFDGLLETPAWAGFIGLLSTSEGLRPLLISARDSGADLLTAIKTVVLLLFPVMFAGVYGVFAALSARCAKGKLPVGDVANSLAPSLVSIAIGYHVAHYLSYLLLAGQLVIPLASDPFGWGWDLFGTSGYAMDITIINAKTVWYVAVAAIVLGHVAAVYAAHVTAHRIYGFPRLALRSQAPMLVLMVLYTMSSLWILSQPIIAD